VAYATLAAGVPTAAAVAVERRLPRAPLVAAAVWAALGGRSLRRTATRLAAAVEAGDLALARALAPSLVSRRPDALDGPELLRAAVESVAENTGDAVTGTLLWTALLGAPGAVLHRCVNTLDAMVGYRDERHLAFGWGSARLDDLLGLPVARATALGAVLAAPLAGGDPRAAWRIWRRDGRRHPSPNAGHCEAAFAGALGLTLGGAARYGEVREVRPRLGDGRAPTAADVRRAARLSALTTWLLASAFATIAARRR
jgi:adenosylcobinamide-phosphate synthase